MTQPIPAYLQRRLDAEHTVTTAVQAILEVALVTLKAQPESELVQSSWSAGRDHAIGCLGDVLQEVSRTLERWPEVEADVAEEQSAMAVGPEGYAARHCPGGVL